eukprot:ANDGO_00033.mRNA.1 putative bifunctional methylthioribulose-1-phosphate dehydratase/enolase-phosphatase E1 1
MAGKKSRDLEAGDAHAVHELPAKRVRLLSTSVSLPLMLDGIQCVFVDIEGTTTPLSFVSSVLFPYARKNTETFLHDTYESSATADALEKLRALNSVPAVAAASAGKAEVVRSAVACVSHLMLADAKAPALKNLQGLVWERGYANGDLQGVVFPDVRPSFERWVARGINIHIWSSGSVLAQKLLFKYSNLGDLSGFIVGYHDPQHVGYSKTDKESYVHLAKVAGVKPSQCLFLTDRSEEASAAALSHVRSILLVRPGNPDPPADCEFSCVSSFSFLG